MKKKFVRDVIGFTIGFTVGMAIKQVIGASMPVNIGAFNKVTIKIGAGLISMLVAEETNKMIQNMITEVQVAAKVKPLVVVMDID